MTTKTFKAALMGEIRGEIKLIDVPIKKMINYRGFKLVIHRPIYGGKVGTAGWQVSEYSTGMNTGSLTKGDTLKEAEASTSSLDVIPLEAWRKAISNQKIINIMQ